LPGQENLLQWGQDRCAGTFRSTHVTGPASRAIRRGGSQPHRGRHPVVAALPDPAAARTWQALAGTGGDPRGPRPHAVL